MHGATIRFTPIFCHLAPPHCRDINTFSAIDILILTTSVSICVQSFNLEYNGIKSLPNDKIHPQDCTMSRPRRNPNIPLCANGQNVLNFAFTSHLKPRRRMKPKNIARTLHGSYLVSLSFNTLWEVKPELPAPLL